MGRKRRFEEYCLDGGKFTESRPAKRVCLEPLIVMTWGQLEEWVRRVVQDEMQKIMRVETFTGECNYIS